MTVIVNECVPLCCIVIGFFYIVKNVSYEVYDTVLSIEG